MRIDRLLSGDHLCHEKVRRGYTKALAKQLIAKGIRANVVAPRPLLDGPAIHRRSAPGKGHEIRRAELVQSPRPIRRDRAHLYATGVAGRQLYHWRGLWRDGRRGYRLNSAGL